MVIDRRASGEHIEQAAHRQEREAFPDQDLDDLTKVRRRNRQGARAELAMARLVNPMKGEDRSLSGVPPADQFRNPCDG
jgi:hypothetical protein